MNRASRNPSSPARAEVSRAAFAAALLAAAVCAACSAAVPPPDTGAEVIARVGSRPVTRGAFDAFLAATLGSAREAAAAGAELKSRLLEQYLDEELLVGAAIAQGLQVSDEEVKAFQPASTGASGEMIRRILLTRKFKHEVILNGLAVSAEEVERYFNEHLPEYRQPARVVIRQILIDSAQEAESIRKDLRDHPDRFEQIAETSSLAPDGGKPFGLEEELLPEALRRAVDQLEQGALSEVVEDPQGFFILKLEERQPEKEADLEEARQRIELKLLQERSQRKYRDFLLALRGKTKVKIEKDKLGFTYERKGES